MATAAPITTPHRAVRVRQVALPTEHGGWAFLLEPLAAGMAIAFSAGAPWIALITVGAFLTRQPLKVLIADRFGMRNRARAGLALRFLVGYGAIFALGIAGTLFTVGVQPLLPFVLVLPFAGFQIYIDASGQSRKLIPELTGAIVMSASMASIGLSANMPFANAVALWAIFASRSIASILYVRERLRLEKGKWYSRIIPTLAHVAALLLVSMLAFYGLSSFLTIMAMSILAYRAIAGLSPGRTRMKAMQIGVWEIIYGTAVVLSVVIGHHAGF
ncbi:MAG: YwiC-like family protein [Acidobacteria bacterium]|nr:YwiC-like family protein [Acidobacteriota bacterium]MCW5949376.1 YwiC-like family protein [Pyrinomonadaceae bacterium]